MTNHELVARTAAGLRKIDKPDAFLYYDAVLETIFDCNELCGIPVYHTAATTFPYWDQMVTKCPVIPISLHEQDYLQISRFLEGVDDYDYKG